MAYKSILEKLERTVEQYRCQVANRHVLQRRSPKRLPKNKPLWDLPMIASSCCYLYPNNSNASAIFSDYSQAVKANSYDGTPELKDRLLDCAPDRDRRIGASTKLDGCHNQVGRCAEPHAARKCIKTLSARNGNIPVDRIIFSIAHVIKTGEPRNPCAICKRVFPNIRIFPKLK